MRTNCKRNPIYSTKFVDSNKICVALHLIAIRMIWKLKSKDKNIELKVHVSKRIESPRQMYQPNDIRTGTQYYHSSMWTRRAHQLYISIWTHGCARGFYWTMINSGVFLSFLSLGQLAATAVFYQSLWTHWIDHCLIDQLIHRTALYDNNHKRLFVCFHRDCVLFGLNGRWGQNGFCYGHWCVFGFLFRRWKGNNLLNFVKRPFITFNLWSFSFAFYPLSIVATATFYCTIIKYSVPICFSSLRLGCVRARQRRTKYLLAVGKSNVSFIFICCCCWKIELGFAVEDSTFAIGKTHLSNEISRTFWLFVALNSIQFQN